MRDLPRRANSQSTDVRPGLMFFCMGNAIMRPIRVLATPDKGRGVADAVRNSVTPVVLVGWRGFRSYPEGRR